MDKVRQLKLNSTTYEIDLPKNSNKGIYFVEGNTTGTAGVWTGSNSDITEYVDGLVINYKVGIAGISSGTTLNINGLGAKKCYLRGTTALTTQYAVGTMILLSYSSTANSNKGGFYQADYDANTKTSAGATDTSSKIYLVGATTQATSPTTYTHDTVYVNTDGHLYDTDVRVSTVDHTHEVTVSGTTGANSGTAVKAVTGYSNFNGGSGDLKVYPNDTTTTAETLAPSNRIPYVASASHTPASLGTASTGTVTISGGSYSGTTKYIKATSTKAGTASVGINGGSGSLTNDGTSTTGIKYIESVSGGSAVTPTTKYMKFSAGTTTKSGATPKYTSTNSGANNVEDGVSVVTKISATDPTITLTENSSNETGRITYIKSVTKGDYTPEGSVTLTSGTAPSMGAATTKYLVATATGTAIGSTGTGACAPNGHTHAVTVQGDTEAESNNAVKAVTGYSSFSGGALTGTTTFNTNAIKAIGGTRNYGFSANTSNVVTAPSYADGILSFTLVNASTQDAHTGTAAATGTVGFTAASLGTPTTSNVTPSGHTHAYGSSIAITSGANSGTKVTALTGVKVTAQPTVTLTAETTNTNGGIQYVHAQGTFNAGTTPPKSASFAGTKTNALVTSATTRYLSATASGTKANVTGSATVAPNGHTHTYDKTTSITLTAGTAPSIDFDTKTTTDTPYISAVSGGSAVSATTKYLKHTHNAASLTGTTTFATEGIKEVSLSTTTTSADGPGVITAISGDAPSLGGTKTFVTDYPNFSGGSASHTVKYLLHSHTGASLGTASTANAAPHTHTHSYGNSTTALKTSEDKGSNS